MTFAKSHQPAGWALVGTGQIAAQFAEDLVKQRNTKPVAVLSRNKERALAFGSQFGVASDGCYDNFDALLKDPRVRVVYIATPHTRHVEDSLRCIQANKHVLCEKPLALNEADAQRVFDAAKTHNVFCMEALWSRFIPALVEVQRIVHSGELGRLMSVDVDFGFDGTKDAPARLMDPALGGGALLDIGVYPLSLVTALLPPGSQTDLPKVVRAAATRDAKGCDETFSAELAYHPVAERGRPAKAVTLSMQLSVVEDTSQTAVVRGSKGVLVIDAPQHNPDSFSINGGARVTKPKAGHGLHYQVAEVEACLAKGQLQSAVVPWEESVRWAATYQRLSAAALQTQQPPARAASDTAPPVRMGLIGCGRIGQLHAQNLHTLRGVDLAWVVDAVLPAAEVAAAGTGDGACQPHTLDALPGLLAAPEGDVAHVDGVLVCTPTHTHPALVHQALAARKAVFCEKPMSTDPAMVREALRAAKAAGRPLVVGYQRPFDPDLAELLVQTRKAYAQGHVLRSVSMRTYDAPRAPDSYLRICGPIFADMMCHDFNVLAEILPPGDLQGARVQVATAPFPDTELGDRSALVTALTRAGTLCIIEAHRESNNGYDNTIDVCFEHKTFALRSRPRTFITTACADGTLRTADYADGFISKYSAAYAQEMAYLVEVVGGVRCDVAAAAGESAVAAVALAHAAQQAKEGGTAVTLNL